jgi:hypothetical protein
MKRIIVTAIAVCLPFSMSLAASPDKEHPPQKATEKATPEMKNPGGTESLHPPQKAMDEATPTEKDPGASGASSGDSGAAAGGSQAQQAKFPDWDTRKAGQSVDLKSSGKQAE